MVSIDSWVRFALTELYAVLLMAFLFRHSLEETGRSVWLKILLAMLAMYLAHLFYVLLSPTYFFRHRATCVGHQLVIKIHEHGYRGRGFGDPAHARRERTAFRVLAQQLEPRIVGYLTFNCLGG